MEYFLKLSLLSLLIWGTDQFCWGWLGGAMVLGKLPVPRLPTNLKYRRARAYCTCSRCRWGLFGHFFLSGIVSHFYLPLSGRQPDID